MKSTFPLPAGLVFLLAGCKDMGFAAAEDGDGWGDTGSNFDEEPGDDGSSDGDSDTDTDWGSEVEDDYLKLEPASTNVYVFVANPSRDTVTRISVPSLGVITTDVGANPAAVATTADFRTAVTFNMDSDDVSIIDADTLSTVTVDVRPNFNAMVMSPDGRWVICFHDPDADDSEDDDSGAQSYNEISVVDVVNAVHYPLVVGFKPHDIQFTADGSIAAVVSDAYLGVVDLAGDEPTRTLIPLSDDLLDPPIAEEVLLAPSGTYAFVRQYGVDTLLLVDLKTQETEALVVGSFPTDLDVSPDGLEAIAVARGSQELWVYDIADPWDEAKVITMPADEVFGSLLMSPDNSKGLLYSTQTGISHYGTWDRDDDSVTVRSLVKPVASMGVSPTGGTALVFHDKAHGDVDPDDPFYSKYALTLIDLDDFFSNPLLLPAEPTAYANTEDGQTGFFIMDGEPLLEVLHYGSLLYDEVPLKSDPVHLGVLPDTTWAYVSQEHDLGRISFYDFDDETLQTLTGFELNSGIEHND